MAASESIKNIVDNQINCLIKNLVVVFLSFRYKIYKNFSFFITTRIFFFLDNLVSLISSFCADAQTFQNDMETTFFFHTLQYWKTYFFNSLESYNTIGVLNVEQKINCLYTLKLKLPVVLKKIKILNLCLNTYDPSRTSDFTLPSKIS